MSELVDRPTEEEIAARHTIAHELASPIRGTAIVADLLAEALESTSPDLSLIRDLSSQLTSLVTDSSDRLRAFGTALDG